VDSLFPQVSDWHFADRKLDAIEGNFNWQSDDQHFFQTRGAK
jgi:hypothetical protein